MAAPTLNIRIEPVLPKKAPGDFHAALAIREVVFIEAQEVPADLERDDLHGDAFHVLAWEGPHAVGPGRLGTLTATPAGASGTWGVTGRMAGVTVSRCKGQGRMVGPAPSDVARARRLTAQAHRRGTRSP